MTSIWIPGWQFGSAALQPLMTQSAATAPQCWTYDPPAAELNAWLDARVSELPQQCVLVGWSLGGMLACALAQRSDRVAQVLVLNANVRFAGGPGLSPAVAENFLQRYQRNAEQTRRRFAQLVDADAPERVADHLLASDQLPYLHWLYQLNLAERPLNSPVSVLLAEDDQLVPVASACAAWQALGARVQTLPGQHSLPLRHTPQVAAWLQAEGLPHG